MTFGLTALLFKHRRKDRLLVGLGIAAAVGVTIQALLGALTVKLKLPWWVSSTHLAVAMTFYSLTVTLAWLTRQRLAEPAPRASEPVLRGAIFGVVALTFLQIVAGGLMRHLRGGLACGLEFPLCLGSLWPLDGHLGVHLHMVHRVLGVIVGVAVGWLCWRTWKEPRAGAGVRWLSTFSAFLVVVQIVLGILTVLWSRELVTMTVHSSVAAVLLAAVVSLYWLANPRPRLVEPRSREAPSGALEAL
jgi:cytochrome c oxidase assembly protein subunit 15